MNEEYDMDGFDNLVREVKADALKSTYARNVHDAMLHGWIGAQKSLLPQIAKLKAALDAIHLRATFELSEPAGREVEALQEICDLVEGMEVSDED